MKTRQTGRPGDRPSGGRSNRDDRRRHAPGKPPVRKGQREDDDRRSTSQRTPTQRPAAAVARWRNGDVLYGRHAVEEALLAGRRNHHRLLIADGVKPDARIERMRELARQSETLIEMAPRPLLDDLTEGANHQGVALETSEYPYAELPELLEEPGIFLVIDHLQDPQNIGTLLRAAEACGVSGVAIARDRAASITPAVVNASAGAVEHLQIAQETNLGRTIDKLNEAGWWIVGLDAGEDASDLFSFDLPAPVALVIGAEGPGLTPSLRARCQLIASLPMAGKIESLNAATAGSIALYDLRRRQLSTVPKSS